MTRWCKECGIGVITPIAKAGRHTRYKYHAALKVPADLEIPTCDYCGSEWIGPKEAEALDAALEKEESTVATIFQDKARAEGREPDELDIAADACITTARALSKQYDELIQAADKIRSRIRSENMAAYKRNR